MVYQNIEFNSYVYDSKNMMSCKYLNKYLDLHAENNIIEPAQCLVNALPDDLHFKHVIVIPAYRESSSFIKRLLSSPIADNVLFIIVVNQPDTDNNIVPQIDLSRFIKNSGNSIFKSNILELIASPNQHYFLVVDAFTQALPAEQGVGLARKIGTDIAILLINNNKIQTNWIHSTDADAYLPANYFHVCQLLENLPAKNQPVAVSYNFSHVSEDVALNAANNLYETALRYYVAGLSYAKSPYNFFTIGSLIAFKAKAYSMVRGFPKRSAGEDFYLLNKLAKLGDIEFLKESVVNIDARASDRVPFGTGPSVTHILQLKADNKPYCYYHPQVFEELKTCIFHFDSLWVNRFNFNQWLSELSFESQNALHDSKLALFVDKQKNNNQIQFNKQLTVWFDAFKTLKFIHSLRDNKYFDIPLLEAIELANFPIEN